jgi:hypothetical protein
LDVVVDEGADAGQPSPEQHAAFLDFVDKLGLGAHRDEIENLVQRMREDDYARGDDASAPPP